MEDFRYVALGTRRGLKVQIWRGAGMDNLPAHFTAYFLLYPSACEFTPRCESLCPLSPAGTVYQSLACVNPECQRFRLVGQGNLVIRKVYGYDRMLFAWPCRDEGSAPTSQKEMGRLNNAPFFLGDQTPGLDVVQSKLRNSSNGISA